MDCEFAVSVHLSSPSGICPFYLLPKAWEDKRIKINNGFSVLRINTVVNKMDKSLLL